MTPGQEAAHRMKRAAADGLNECADKVLADAIPETPMELGDLRASAISPANDFDGTHSASEDHLVAVVSFNTRYAAAQHEGVMVYERDGHMIEWVVRHHTEPGTKTKYLEDPLKAMIPRFEAYVAARVREAMAK